PTARQLLGDRRRCSLHDGSLARARAVTRQSSPPNPTQDLLFGVLLLHPLTGGNLLLGCRDVLEQLGPFDQSLVLRNIQENGGAAASLSQNQGTTGVAN